MTFLYIEVLASTSPAHVSLECLLYCPCFDRISRGLGLMCTLVQIDTCNKFLTVIKHCKTDDIFCVQTISTITVTVWLCLVSVLAFSHLPPQIHFPPSFLLHVQEPELFGLWAALLPDICWFCRWEHGEDEREFVPVISPFNSFHTGYCGLAAPLY